MRFGFKFGLDVPHGSTPIDGGPTGNFNIERLRIAHRPSRDVSETYESAHDMVPNPFVGPTILGEPILLFSADTNSAEILLRIGTTEMVFGPRMLVTIDGNSSSLHWNTPKNAYVGSSPGIALSAKNAFDNEHGLNAVYDATYLVVHNGEAITHGGEFVYHVETMDI